MWEALDIWADTCRPNIDPGTSELGSLEARRVLLFTQGVRNRTKGVPVGTSLQRHVAFPCGLGQAFLRVSCVTLGYSGFSGHYLTGLLGELRRADGVKAIRIQSWDFYRCSEFLLT